jgi:hypothetical protein
MTGGCKRFLEKTNRSPSSFSIVTKSKLGSDEYLMHASVFYYYPNGNPSENATDYEM